MIVGVNSQMVLILPDEISDKTEGGIHIADTVKANLARQQNRGIVQLVGDKCEWAKKGDYLSFYRGAATPITEDNVEYILIHEEHTLAKIQTNDKKNAKL
jgi:co-chaperonin GroES (HSP10)